MRFRKKGQAYKRIYTNPASTAGFFYDSRQQLPAMNRTGRLYKFAQVYVKVNPGKIRKSLQELSINIQPKYSFRNYFFCSSFFFVTIIITPFFPFSPYIFTADSSFSTVIVWILFTSISFTGPVRITSSTT